MFLSGKELFCLRSTMEMLFATNEVIGGSNPSAGTNSN